MNYLNRNQSDIESKRLFWNRCIAFMIALMLLLSLNLAVGPLAYAGFTVIQDFDNRNLGPLGESNGVINVNRNAGFADAEVILDALNRFDLGPSNQALRITDSTSQAPIVVQIQAGVLDTFAGAADDDAYTIAYDFYDMSSGNAQLSLRGKRDQTNTSDGFLAAIATGSLTGGSSTGSYNLNQRATFQINVTDEAAGLYDAFVIENNQIVATFSGSNFIDGGSNNLLNVLDFRTFNGTTGVNILVDNIRVSGDLIAPPIPEPATVSMLGLALLACTKRLRG